MTGDGLKTTACPDVITCWYNRGLISAPKNAKISSCALCMYIIIPASLETHNII
jgi:hypothetical protein